MRKQMAASLLAAHERSRPGGRCQCLLGNASLRPPLPLSLRRLPSIAQAALRAALAIASRFFVLTATNNNTLSLKTKHSTPTKITPSQASCCVSFSLHRHNAHPLATGPLELSMECSCLYTTSPSSRGGCAANQFRPVLDHC